MRPSWSLCSLRVTNNHDLWPCAELGWNREEPLPHPSPREGQGVGSAIENTAKGRKYGIPNPGDNRLAHKKS